MPALELGTSTISAFRDSGRSIIDAVKDNSSINSNKFTNIRKSISRLTLHLFTEI